MTDGSQRYSLVYGMTLSFLAIVCALLWYGRSNERVRYYQIQRSLDSLRAKASVTVVTWDGREVMPRRISFIHSSEVDTPYIGRKALGWLIDRQSPFPGVSLGEVIASVRSVGRFGVGRGRGRRHKGIDLPADLGTPVRAIRPGLVIFADEFIDSLNFPGMRIDYGQTVKILDPLGLEWWYSHLENPLHVVLDSMVSGGETVLGLVGITGNVARVLRDSRYGYPHCHLTLYDPYEKQIVVPQKWLSGGIDGDRIVRALEVFSSE